MNEAMAPVPPDHPLMAAWKAYTRTEAYANTIGWAQDHRHTEGSLWAAFERGWRAHALVGEGMPEFAPGELCTCGHAFMYHEPGCVVSAKHCAAFQYAGK